MAGKPRLKWQPHHAFFPHRFTHDQSGYALPQMGARRRSRWFEWIFVAYDGKSRKCYRPFKSAEIASNRHA